MNAAVAAMPTQAQLLSPKHRYGIKAALALTVAYLVPMWQGWQNATTALTTVMLIAVFGSVGDSVYKGVLRTFGTLLGALLGLALVALFPQERFAYLTLLSVAVVSLLHLARRHTDDPTFFVLTAVTMMSMFQNGEVDHLFMYGITKTAMTIWAIFVYTMVGILILPVPHETTTRRDMERLLDAVDNATDITPDGDTLSTLFEAQTAFRRAVATHTATALGDAMSRRTWRAVAAALDEAVAKAALFHTVMRERNGAACRLCRDDLTAWRRHIRHLTAELRGVSRNTTEPPVPASSCLETHCPLLAQSLHDLREALRRASAVLHTRAPSASTGLSLLRPTTADDAVAAFITFATFWAATALWIFFNPPGGFFLVSLAVVLSLYTAMTPLSPVVLFVAFSLSFLFGIVAYIFVLPNLTTGWELAAFLFLYGFVGFAMLPGEVSFIFLLPLTLFGIQNTQVYAFDIFLLLLIMFYLFLFILLFFDYIPFAQRPNNRVLSLHRRFFDAAAAYVRRARPADLARVTMYRRELEAWTAKIDADYFGVDREKLTRYLVRLTLFETLLSLFVKQADASDTHRFAEAISAFPESQTQHANDDSPLVATIFARLDALAREYRTLGLDALKESRF